VASRNVCEPGALSVTGVPFNVIVVLSSADAPAPAVRSPPKDRNASLIAEYWHCDTGVKIPHVAPASCNWAPCWLDYRNCKSSSRGAALLSIV
jgi:hypothetical protein